MKFLSIGVLLLALASAAACGAETPTPSRPPATGSTVAPSEPTASATPEQQWGTLVVAVTSPDGTPMEGVPIELTALDPGTMVPDYESAPLTGPDGTVEIPGVSGEFEVATVLDGAENDAGEVAVEAGATARIDLVVSA